MRSNTRELHRLARACAELEQRWQQEDQAPPADSQHALDLLIACPAKGCRVAAAFAPAVAHGQHPTREQAIP